MVRDTTERLVEFSPQFCYPVSNIHITLVEDIPLNYDWVTTAIEQ
jgi:hypothetical protein